MAHIKVQKIADPQERTLPVFKEMEAVLDRIRNRASEMFSGRGFGDGHALDDWLSAQREICWPAGELVEEDKAYTLSLALPGFEPGDISVTATAHDLIVHAECKTEGKKEEEAKKGQRVCWSEFRANDVYRQVDLPKNIDPQSVSASLQNGLLKIVATKTEQPVRVAAVRTSNRPLITEGAIRAIWGRGADSEPRIIRVSRAFECVGTNTVSFAGYTYNAQG